MQIGISYKYPRGEVLTYGMALKMLRFHMAEIGDEIRDRVAERTPVDTGALKEDAAWRPLTKTGTQGSLLEWFYHTDYQMAEWGREYSLYQEGPPLGKRTYTNEPRHMLYDIETKDSEAIREWAQQVVDDAYQTAVEQASYVEGSGGTS